MIHRVVLVDDMPEIRQILRLILEHAGPFEVVGEASNGTDAIAVVGELLPDLVVMDVEMRGGPSGWEVLPRIREAAPHTAVVILSGSASDPMQHERESMADAVLEKGLSPQELNDALLAILDDPARASSAASASASSSVRGPSPATPPAPPRSAAEVLAAVLEATSDAVVEVSASGVVQTWNAGAERVFGGTATEAVGRPFASWPVDDAALIRTTVPGGEVVVVRGRPGGDTDVERLLLELERAGRELEGFASVASHDLAQPLQVAYGYLEMVRSEFAEGMDEIAVGWIDAAVGSLERMRLLVQDILSFASSGNREVPCEAVSVEDAARAAIAAIESFVEERAAQVSLRPLLPVVHAHDGHLTQVLERVLDNAVRFVPDGTTPVVEVFADEGPSEWILTVADNGPGIPPALAERVFDVFYRGPKSAKSGTGLGLSISRNLVARMGGRIWVEDRPEGATGAWIRFALPKEST